jgi:hypothetical protein
MIYAATGFTVVAFILIYYMFNRLKESIIEFVDLISDEYNMSIQDADILEMLLIGLSKTIVFISCTSLLLIYILTVVEM